MNKLIGSLIISLFISCNSESTSFKLCSGGLYPYYHPELKYKGSFYAIKNHFYNGYNKVNSENNNGIVRIQFRVNCKGQAGDFTMETYSLEYISNDMDDRITRQLLKLTQKLDNWIPAVDEDGNTLNSHKFFAFKIINGELKDILPK